MIAPECCPLCGSPSPRMLVAHIQAVVASYYDMPLNYMTSAQRGWRYSHPRQVAMYLTAQLTPRSLPDIGLRFRRDHTTVIHAIRAVQKRAAADAELARDILCLIEQLTPVNNGEEPTISKNLGAGNAIEQSVKTQVESMAA